MTDHRPAVEQAIRDLIAEHPDLPIRASFRRGPIFGPFDTEVSYETAETPNRPHEFFVHVVPDHLEVGVAAVADAHELAAVGAPTFVELPESSYGVVDVESLTGSRFHVELLGAIRAKAAVVAEMRQAVAP